MDSERFLTNIITTLATSPDLRTTIDNLALLATNGLADWCAVYVFENEQTIRRLSVAPTPQPELVFPLVLQASAGPAYVRRTGEAQLLTKLSVDIFENIGIKPEDLVLSDGRKLSRYACMPAVARNRTIGAVVFMSANPELQFRETELTLAASLANAAAVAMDNSKLYRDAQEANRLKDEFVAMVSHELRTPLTPMLGCVHLLRTTKLSQVNFDRALEMIERNAQTQVHIVEDLLDASRIVAGKLHLVMKSTTVTPVVEAAIETVISSAEAKGVKIITDFEDVQTPINADPHRLQQIIWNLLSNAVKFTPPEGRIDVSIRADGNDVQIQVIDTGIGIPPDFLPYIFDRFRQGTDVGSKMRSGLGLGLTIVRHLVDLHSGSIHAASAGPGKGAVFTLRFPFVARRAVTATFGSEK
jgi:signal transduction histidine kinase